MYAKEIRKKTLFLTLKLEQKKLQICIFGRGKNLTPG